MQLRQIRRLPGRYREDDVPELPPKPTAVEPTTPYDPTLRPAVFPTLDLDQFPPDHAEETPQASATTSAPEEPALVFKDSRISQEFTMAECTTDPGEFIPRFGEEPEDQLSSPLAADELHVEWGDLPKAIKIIVIRELCTEMHFFDAVTFIKLDDLDMNEFLDMLAGEVALYDKEMGRLNIVLQRQNELLLGGFVDQAREEWSIFLTQESNQASSENDEKFCLFSIKREDIARGKIFLLDFRCREEFPDFDPRTAPKHVVEEMRSIPTSAALHAVIGRLDSYIGTDVTCEDPVWERSLIKQYREAQKLIEEENELALLTSDVSAVQGQQGPGKSDGAAKTPSPTSDRASNNGEADDESDPPSSKKKKPVNKKVKTKASDELVNKKLGSKKATPKKKNKVHAPLPPSALRNVTNYEDVETPEQSRAQSPVSPLFSPESTWIPSIASSPLALPKFPSRSPSPVACGPHKHDAVNTAENASVGEQHLTEAGQASSQIPNNPAETSNELKVTQSPISTAEEAREKSGPTGLSTSRSSVSAEPTIASVGASFLSEKLAAYAKSLDELNTAKSGHVDDVSTSSALINKTHDEVDVTSLKTEDDAKTVPTDEVDGLAAPKLEEKTEKVVDPSFDFPAYEGVKNVTKTDITENTVHNHLEVSKSTGMGDNKPVIEGESGGNGASDPKASEKRTRTSTPDEPSRVLKKQRV